MRTLRCSSVVTAPGGIADTYGGQRGSRSGYTVTLLPAPIVYLKGSGDSKRWRWVSTHTSTKDRDQPRLGSASGTLPRYGALSLCGVPLAWSSSSTPLIIPSGNNPIEDGWYLVDAWLSAHPSAHPRHRSHGFTCH